jgi:hypothetical protein
MLEFGFAKEVQTGKIREAQGVEPNVTNIPLWWNKVL